MVKRRQVEKFHRAPTAEKEEIECNPYAIFHQAIENCKPIIGLANVQRGGRNYQVSQEHSSGELSTFRVISHVDNYTAMFLEMAL